MKSPAIICASIGALALATIAATAPVQARGFGRAFVGGAVAGAVLAGAASSAYAYAPGPGYAYESYGWRPGYYGRYGHPYETYGVYDESQHGGEPSYTRPFGD